VVVSSQRASLRQCTERTVCGRTEQRRPHGFKRGEPKVRMAWGSFLIARVNPNLRVNLNSCPQRWQAGPPK